MDVVETILRRNEALVKDVLRLQRKLGRMAYWRNKERAAKLELQAALNAKLAEEVSRA